MQTVVIGTRGSRLALAQTRQIVEALARYHPTLDLRIETIVTHGDQNPDDPLQHMHRKGVFTSELEAALLAGRIDLAVHSAKDLPAPLPAELAIICTPPREDPREALIQGSGFRTQDSGLRVPATGELRQGSGVSGQDVGPVFDCDPPDVPGSRSATAPTTLLAEGALVGTCSLRRQAQLARLRPDLRFGPIRGNIETRIAKVRRGEFDGTVLALAGLRRAGLEHEAAAVFNIDVIVPAPGQGILAIEARAADAWLAELIAPLDHAPTRLALECERRVVSGLGATCFTPIGVLAEIDGDALSVRARVLTLGGRATAEAALRGHSGNHATLVDRVIRTIDAQRKQWTEPGGPDAPHVG